MWASRSAALGSRLDAHTAEIVNELLARWETLDVEVRVRLARTLLTKIHGDQLNPAPLDERSLREHLERLARGA